NLIMSYSRLCLRSAYVPYALLLLLFGCGKQPAGQQAAAPAPQPTVKLAPPTPIAEKKVELGEPSWDPRWDVVVEQALPPEMISAKVARQVRSYCPRFGS